MYRPQRHYQSGNAGPCLLLGLLLPVVALGQDTIELGAGYVSEDSFKMGEYTGLNESQGYGVSAFNIGRRDAYNADTANYWQVIGTNLGLDTRSLEATGGYRGKVDVSVSWRELPHYRFDNQVRTPFLGAGSARQQLPSGWVGASSTSGFTELQSSLSTIAIHTDREKLAMTLDWQLHPQWSVSGKYQHETKKGNDTLGAIFGSNGGNPRGAILAAPVDYVTDNFRIGLSRQGNKGQTDFFISASLFDNANRSLQWDNPFNNGSWADGAGYEAGAVGELALAPDNRYWQTGISNVYRLGESSRLSSSLSLGKMTQDENFLSYSNVFTAGSPLPATRLEGEVRTTNALLDYTTRLGQSTRLHLRYSFDERDNNTDVHVFLRIPGDAAGQGSSDSSNARLNRPYSFRNQKFSLDGNYRLGSSARLTLGYSLEDKERDLVDVAQTKEHTGKVKLDLPDIAGGRGWLQYARSIRDGSTYISNQGFLSGHNPDFIQTLAGNELFENDPLLRRYHLADRDRNQLSGSFSMAPTDKISLDIMGRHNRDDFPDSKIGLQASDSQHLTLNLNLDASSDWHGYSYITTERYKNRQQGYARRGGGNPTPFFPESVRLPGNNWQMTSEDKVITVGAGIDWTLLQEKLQLSVDLNRSDAATETSPYSSGLDWAGFSDIDSTITSLNLKGSYAPGNRYTIGFRYRFEDYKSTDFAFDQVATDTLGNIILLGNASPNYSGHIVELSFLYTLPGN